MRNGIEIHLVAHRYFLVPEQQEAFCRGDARQAVLFPLRYEQHPVGMHGDGMLPAQLYQHLSFEHERVHRSNRHYQSGLLRVQLIRTVKIRFHTSVDN